jgi:hypothetical protein
MKALKTLTFLYGLLSLTFNSFCQDKTDNTNCTQPATIIFFRTFNIFSFKFNYNLFSGDSLLARMQTNDVLILETYGQRVAFSAAAKAPTLNSEKGTKYQRRKTVEYSFAVQPGQVYLVQCNFLNESLFDYPRQPTARLMKNDELPKYLRKRFIKRELKKHLFRKWLRTKGMGHKYSE